MMRLNWILLFLVSVIVSAQKKEPEHYSYPFEDYYQPLTMNVNAVLLKRDDGTGGFDLKDAEEKQLLSDYMENMNRVFSNFQPLPNPAGCYMGTDFVKDAKIRLSFHILEVKNSFYWNYLNGSIPESKNFSGFSPTEGWYIKPLDDSISGLNIPKAVNIYLTENGNRFDDIVKKRGIGYDVTGSMAGQSPTTQNLNRSSQIHAPNLYLRYISQRYKATKEYNQPWSVTKGWWLSSGLSHELGHNLGLGHSNEYYKTNACKYSLMSQGGTDPRNWLPPTEIKKMHWNLTRTNLMQFVTPESAYGATWKLNEDTVWDKPRRFYHNFELASNLTLTISDSIILPPQGYIKLNKNSKIIFKHKGKIVDAYGKEFKNFEKHKTAKILKE